MADNNFSVLLNANLDTSNVPKELKNLNAQLAKSTSNTVKLKVGIDENNKPIFNDFIKTVNTYKDKANNIFKQINLKNIDTGEIETKFKQVTSAIKNVSETTRSFVDDSGVLNTVVRNVDRLGQTVQTHTKTYKEFGQNIKEVTTYIEDSQGNLTQVGETFKQVSSVVSETSKSINKYKDDTGAVVTEITELTKQGENLRTVIREEVDEQGRVIKSTELWNNATNSLISSHQEIINDEIKLTDQHRKLQQTITNTVSSVHKYINGIGNLVTETTSYNQANEKIVTTVTEETNALGVLTRTTREYNETQDKVIKTDIQIINNEAERQKLEQQLAQNKKQLITTTREELQTIEREGEQYKAVVRTIQEQIDANTTLTTTITTYKNKLGETVVETEKVNQAGEHVAQSTKTVTKELEKEAQANKNASNYARENAQAHDTLGNSLARALTTLTQYYVASLPIRAFRTAVSEAVTTVRDFDSALIEFRKVSDLAGESLTNYVAKLAEMGEITGSTMQAMVEASTEFRKSGFSDEDSAKLASIAEKYRNVADEEISAGEAASFIIAQMKAFNIEAGQAEHIIDAVNEVANNYSVSSADLARNLGNMSEIMAINNVSMEEQLGMLTGVTEITRNASSASRGLVMISSRLTQVLDDTSSTGKKLTAIYADLGIELKDENGQLRSHYEILGDLAKQWNNLSENQQKYIALTSAGARQQQNFVALMDNWNNVARATASAYNSMGSAQRENEKVMDSIAKKVEILRSEFQQLIIGKGGLQDFAKTILDVGIKILKFANSDIGKVVVAFTTLLGTIKLIGVALKTDLIIGLVSTAKELMLTATLSGVATTSIEAFNFAVKQLTLSFIENAIAWATTPFGMVTIAVAAVAALTVAFIKYGNRASEAAKKTKELADEANNLKSDISGLEKDLNDIRVQIEKLNKQKLELANPQQLIELEKQTKELETQEAILQRQIELEKQKLELAKQDATEQALKASKETITTHFNQQKADIYSTDYLYGYEPTEQVTWSEELSRATEKTKELIQQRNELIIQSKGVAEQEGETSQAYKVQQEQIVALNDQINEAKSIGYEAAEAVNNITTGLQDNSEETVNLKQEYEGLIDEWNDVVNENDTIEEQTQKTIEQLEQEAEEAEELSKELENLIQSLGITKTEFEGLQAVFGDDSALLNYLQQLAEIRQSLSDTSTVIDNLQDALEVASTALEEYNQNGYLTIDTFQSLMGVSAQYLTALINENGQLEINQTTLGNLIEKLKQEKIHELQSAEAADILAYAQGDVAQMSSMAQTAISNAGVAAYNAGKNAETGASGFWSLADAISAANKAAGGATTIDIDSNIRKIHNSYQNLAKTISNVEVNTTKAANATNKASKSANKAGKSASKAGKAASSAAKDAEKAIKDQNKALEEQKKKYETVIKWISKQYDKEIDKIKKAKDEALDAEEAKIKAKEKEKDKALDAIEAEINALKKEKDARKKYWDDQIDALKKANQERKDSLELQEKLDALEKARNTKVKIYKEGQGFVYDVDQTAVKKAKEELDEYLSEKAYEEELARLEALRDAEANNYEQRIDALEEYKDNVEAQYEQQIADLEAYKDELEKQYDAQIEMYENYKQQFEDMVNAYEESQNKLLAQQLTSIDFENNNWMTRLDNLAKFVSEYNKLQQQLETANTNVQNTAQLNSGSIGATTSSGGGVKNTTATPTTYKTHADILPTVTKQSVQTTKTLGNNNANWRTYQNMPSYARGYASGTDSIKDDQIAIVGENPNQELVIGSKINNGQLMSLDKGTGIVNADSSKTLAGLLNQVGKFGASGFGSGNGTFNNNYNNDSLVINGVTIQGSNIKDPETFVNGLLGLKSKALQRAYTHK